MTLISADDKRYVDVGSEQIWFSVLYTAEVFLQDMMQEITFARDFLSHKKCSASIALETARQINLLRDAFSKIPPENVIYDRNQLSFPAPWSKNLSPVITSCGNLFTTSDGKDLLFELVCLLTYAHYTEVDVYSPN